MTKGEEITDEEEGSERDFGKGFGEEREVGDGAVVGEVGWVQGGFFEDGGDGGKFVGSGKVTKG